MTNKEWEQYDHMERDERELQACIDFARKEGREEGRKIGREEGRKIGREEGRKIGHEEGRKIGHEEGRKIGREEGRKIGREEGRREIFSHVAAILGISLEDVMTMASGISRKA